MELLSRKPLEEIRALKGEVDAGKANVIAVKESFAVEIVTRFHDAKAANEALERRREIAKGEAPDDAPEHQIAAEEGGVSLAKALAVAGLVGSNSEGTRSIKQGAVTLDGKKLGENDGFVKLVAGGRHLVRVGSKNRKFAWLKIV
jgi:tyrosyl-tRNA synthetase